MKITIALASAGLLVFPGLTLTTHTAEEPSAYVFDLSAAPIADATEPAEHPAPAEDPAPVQAPNPTDRVESPLAPEAPALDSLEVPAPGSNEPIDSGEETAKTASVGGFELVTAPLETPEFAVAGVTWEGASPDVVEIRVLTDEWSEWYSLEIDLDEGGTPGTEPYMAAGATGIQVRTSGPAEPSNFQVVLNTGEGTGGTEEEAPIDEATIEPEPNTDDALAENVSVSTEATVLPSVLQRPDDAFIQAAGRTFGDQPSSLMPTTLMAPTRSVPMPAPKVMSRSEWGVGASTIWPASNAKLTGAVIHHTAGVNNYSAAESPGIVRGIWNYHTYGRGWGDIGYNFLVDKYGNIFEGRTGSLASPDTQMPIGAHAAPGNTGSVGVSVMGNYTSKNIEPAALNGVVNVLAWQFGRAGVDPHGTFSYYDRGWRSIAAINGHKDISNTACPARIYPELGKIRTMTKDRITAAATTPGQPGSPPPVATVPSQMAFSYSVQSGHGWPPEGAWGVGDFSGNGYSDLILRTQDGKLLFYEGVGRDQFAPGRQIGHGWNGMKDLFTGFDFDADGINDIVGLRHDGKLFHYSGNGDGTVQPARQIGHGWYFAHMFGLEQGPSGKPAFVGIKDNGDMYIYQTNGAGSFNGTTHHPGYFNYLEGLISIGDWDNTGYSDAIGIDPSGKLFYYSDITQGGWKTRAQIGHGWGAFNQLEVGYSEDGLHRFYAIRNDGRLFTYAYELR